MFSVIARNVCDGMNPDGTLTPAAKLGTLLDLVGLITAIVLGALALCGTGGDIILGINTIPGGGWGMIACAIVGLALLAVMSRRQTIIVPPQQLQPKEE